MQYLADGQIPGLKQHTLGRQTIHGKRGKHGFVDLDPFDLRQIKPVLTQQPDQKTRGTALKPVVAELLFPQKQQHIKRIVDLVFPEEVVAVIPAPQLRKIHIGQPLGKGGFQLLLRIAADRPHRGSRLIVLPDCSNR